jgi:hypothetical protein
VRIHGVGLVLCMAAALPFPGGGQAPRTLGKPDAEHPHAFTRIATVRELRDGRVLVVDERESSLLLADFKSGSIGQVGRQGAGPREYGRPGRIVALPGDTSVLHDPPNTRYLLVGPDGKPGETFRLSEPVWMHLGGRGSVPRGTDARGNLYFEGSPMTTGRGVVPVALDSAPVMRYDRKTMRLDTLAFVQLARGNVRVTPGKTKGMSIQVGAAAFPARDDWAPLPGGGIAVVRVRDYHVDRYSLTGARTAGPPLRIAPVPVTEAEKQAWREERLGRAMSRSVGTVAQNPIEPDWPTAMPPFVFWSTFAAPSGDLWVLRSHRASDVPVYDVFNSAGVLTARAALSARTRLVGFGNGTLYVVRRDDDDLEHLQRYKLSADRGE